MKKNTDQFCRDTIKYSITPSGSIISEKEIKNPIEISLENFEFFNKNFDCCFDLLLEGFEEVIYFGNNELRESAKKICKTNKLDFSDYEDVI
jgi:hypothetical protein